MSTNGGGGIEDARDAIVDTEDEVSGLLTPDEHAIDPDAISDIRAEIYLPSIKETIRIEDEFYDPNVDVRHERKTADHTVVTGHAEFEENASVSDRRHFMVQPLGRAPPELTMTTWLTGDQLYNADRITRENYVEIQCARFVGYAVPRKSSITYSRVYHDKYGWLFETTFEFIGAQWNGLPIDGDER